MNGQAKILCAWLLKDKGKYWNYSGQEWGERQTEAHITVCSRVPNHIEQWWAPGAHKDDDWQRPQQG